MWDMATEEIDEGIVERATEYRIGFLETALLPGVRRGLPRLHQPVKVCDPTSMLPIRPHGFKHSLYMIELRDFDGKRLKRDRPASGTTIVSRLDTDARS